MVAVIRVPVREATPMRARCRPSTTIWMPAAVRAICRMTPTVPTRRRSLGCGSSSFVLCSVRNSMRLPDCSAWLTESIDTGRLMVNGSTLSGNAIVSRSGSTGSSDGTAAGGVVGESDMIPRWFLGSLVPWSLGPFL
jgi:hypothetical protein